MIKYIRLEVEEENIVVLEETLEEYVSSFMVEGVEGYEIFSEDILKLSYSRWKISVFCGEEKLEEIKGFIVRTCEVLKIRIISVGIEEIKESLSEEDRRYSFNVGKVVIFNNEEDYSKFYSESRVPLFVRESLAFGTGKHETTLLCLEFLVEMSERGYRIKEALDLGTGSGILAMGIAKLFEGRVLGVDNDRLALNTAQTFMEVNGVLDRVDIELSEGFKEIHGRKFDLIVANILLNPLIEMVGDFYRGLEEGGYLILSGFLDYQKDRLIDIFEENKFRVIETKEKNKWVCVLLQK